MSVVAPLDLPAAEDLTAWCDGGYHYATDGEALIPYEKGSRYQICTACLAQTVEAHEQWEALRAQGLDETDLRRVDGDR